jgi:putative peptidoglycan lipid II flippase
MKPSRTITRAALVVSGGILLSRIIGYLRNVFIGAELGIGTDTDLYAAAFTVPDYLFFLMAGGYLSITLVPILSSRLVSDDPGAAREAFTAVFRFVVALMMVSTLVALLAATPITELIFPEYTPSQIERLVPMMRITFVSQLFFVAGTVLMAAQYASKRFLIPTVAPIIYNVAIIAGGLIGAAGGDASPEAFIWGGLVGAIIGNFGLQWWGARRCGFWPVRNVAARHPAVREYLTLAIPLMVGQSVVALDEQWPRLFGQFAGEGAQAGLVFARQLNMVPVGVIAQAVGVAAFPFLAGLAAEGRLGDLRSTVKRSVRGALAVGALAGGLVIALADPIVRIAYQYGRFDASATDFVGGLLFFYAFSIPFWAAHQVYTRSFYALRKMWTPVIAGSIITAFAIPTLWYFVNRNGAEGVAGASSLTIAVYTVTIAVLWHVRVSPEDGWEMGRFAFKVAAVAAGAAACAVLAGVLVEPADLADVVGLIVQAVVGTAVYVAGARLLGIHEVAAFLQRVLQVLRRAPTAS